MVSRFMKGEKLPTLHILASSKRTDQSFLETYIETKKKNESKTTLIIDEPQWVIRTDKDSPNKFPVAIGNRFLESEVLAPDSSEELIQTYRDRGYSILMVPMGYYEQFLDDINIALTDAAGISTSNTSRYINGAIWTQCRDESIRNPFTKEIITVGNGADDLAQYSDFFDLSAVPSKYKNKPLYIHLDMSLSGDKTGIAGTWIIGKKPHEEGIPDSKELYYQLAFSVSIKAPKGHQVSFEKNRQFIYWLKEKGFSLKQVSCFKGDTLICTPLGYKKIKDILPGELVYAFNDNNHQVVTSTVYNSVNNGPRTEFIKLWITEDDYIECTPEHLIKTDRGYIMAKDINEFDNIEVDDKLFYKQKLLHTGYFVDNEYLNKYIDLITLNNVKDTSIYSEKHHILPKCYFKLKQIPIDNSDINICCLSYSNHMLAHCLLTKCTIEPFKSKVISAVTQMMSHNRVLPQKDIEEYMNNIELQNLVQNCRCGKKHTKEEIEKISESNKKPHNVHPHSEFKQGHVPANKGVSYIEKYTEQERKEKFGRKQEFIWVNNGVEEKQVLKENGVPESFVMGRLPCKEEIKLKISNILKEKGIKPKAQSGFKNYTNGVTNIRIFPGDEIPVGFVPGRIFDTSTTQSKNFLNSDKFKSIDKVEYESFYLTHTRLETLEHFNISMANHKKICTYYNIKKKWR